MPNIKCGNFLVAGTKYRCEAGNLRTFAEGSRLLLRREPENMHDANAIAVFANVQARMPTPTWLHVGYVPAALAKFLSPMMKAGLVLSAVARRIEPTKLAVWAELVWEQEEPPLTKEDGRVHYVQAYEVCEDEDEEEND